MNIDRPRCTRGSITTDQESAAMIDLLGGKTADQVALTSDQEKRLYKLYNFNPEEDRGKLGSELIQAGTFRNMIRYAQMDGLRLVAFLSRFCKPGKDPLSLIKVLMSEAGYDITLEDRDFDEEDW